MIGRRQLAVGLVAVLALLGGAGVAVATQHRNNSAGGGTLSFADPDPDPAPTESPESTGTPTGEAIAADDPTPDPAPTSSTPATLAPTPTPTPVPIKTTAVARAPRKAPAKAKPKAQPATEPPAADPAPGASGAGRIQYGRTYTGHATFYAATGAGNCSYEASADLMVGAMNQQDYDNSRACGAYLAVTGPTGTTIRIKVVDRCPECPPGAIDLSREAFTKLAPASAGLIQISWKLVSPGLAGPVAYKYKSGSSQYWCGIQVRNHRNPIRSLALKVNGSWKDVPRLEYNYFVSAGGAGCGSAIRITDIFGHRLVDSGIDIAPDQVQSGHAQFSGPS